MEKCLELLSGPSDEERFVGLLIVPKIIKHDDIEGMKKVFAAIGFDFLNRLLEAKGTPDSSTYHR
jgi:hypothetical protein